MSLSIQEINVQNVGPLRQLALRLGKFNLIYGRNERGKTYLVEFVIRSLFRNAKEWGLRSDKGDGKVVVSGLVDGYPMEFSPAGEKKLEDFWEESTVGLPPDFSRLLVVKGAEVELSKKAEGGADKAILKLILSSREILNKIEKKIPASFQKYEIKDGEILGSNIGDRKKYLELRSQLQKIDELFNEIDKGYSGGRRKALMDDIEAVQKQLDEQVQAKQFLAYQTNVELQRLREERRRLPTAKIQEVRAELSLLKQKTVEFRNKREARREHETRSQHYEWLKAAHQIYQEMLSPEVVSVSPFLLVLSLGLIVLAAVFAILKLTAPTIAALVGVLVSGWFYFQKHRQAASRFRETKEVENIRKEFKDKFGRELSGLPVMLELLQNLEEDYNHARLLKKQLAEELNFLKAAERRLDEQITVLAGEKKDAKTWEEVLRLLDNHGQKLEAQIHEKDKLLARLAVDESDYRTERPLVEYSKQRFDALEDKRRKLQAELDAETRRLESLKQRICDLIREDIVTPWEGLIEKLRHKRVEIAEEYKQKTAEIIGKMAVRDVINDLRKTEDSKILAGLKSPEVETPLLHVTGRYQRLGLEGDQLLVSDAFNTFALSELSTGAQEQVLLALRIGFSTKLMNRDGLFLILDDAFQYSDWERRRRLVSQAAVLARHGWQIIYFTMDDNIRALFDEMGKQFGGDYQFFELIS